MIQGIETQFDQICQDSINCKNDGCKYKHQRKFQGVCINYLKDVSKFDGDEEDKPRRCQSKECKLQHFDENKLRDLGDKQTINGFYCFNFCQRQCADENCQLVHKHWIQEFCVKNFVQVCKISKECEKKKHIEWKEIQKQINNKFIIQGCSLQQLIENPLNKPLIFEKYCFDNQIGECPYKKHQCRKIHLDWDDLVTLELQKYVIQPCTHQGVQKDDIQNLVEGKKSFARLICEEKQFQNFKNSLNESNVIDIIFVMDLTGSMAQWKQQMQQNIETVIGQFSKDINNLVRVGFIGYRDTCDSKEDQIVYRNLTQNISQIINFISKLEVKGGGDTAEDVVKGLQQILNLNISRNQESMLCIFLIADSPNHGKQYHDMKFQGADDQLENVEGTPLEDVMKAIKRLKFKNFFFCIKITEHTNKMFQVMQGIMEDMLVITPQTKPEQFSGTVLFTLQQSYTQSQILKKKNNKFWADATYEKPKIDGLGKLGNSKDPQLFWYNYQNQIKNRCRRGDTCLEIELSDKKSQKDLSQTQGVQSNKIIIFNAFDAINNQQVVLKINKEYLTQYEQKGNVNELISQVEEEAKIRYYAQSYACQIAEIYRQKTKQSPNKDEFPPIFYAIPILYQLKQPFKGLKQIYGESQIQNGFFKYSTNQKPLLKDFYYYSVFSHFSYQISNELFVITDLQGSYSIFTDPSFQINQTKLQECEQNPNKELNEEFILQKD